MKQVVLPSATSMLGTLIGEPSVSSRSSALDQSNIGVLNHLANWLHDINFDVEISSLPEEPAKANLIATYLPQGQHIDGGLILAGHSDTVPCDEKLWHSDPYSLSERDSRVHGLGACDMKGFFPIAISAASQVVNKKLKKPLTIIATSDEESGMAGARFLADGGIMKADVTLVGEPTELKPIISHKGAITLSITIQGSSGHSSNPDLGRNAIDSMHTVIQELMEFRKALATNYQTPGFDVSIPTLNLGCLRAGDSPNRICEHSELQIDLRLLPGMNADAIVSDLKQRLYVIGDKLGTPIDVLFLSPAIPAFESPENSHVAKLLETLSGKASGKVAFGTEAPFYQDFSKETVVFGPGSISQAHQPDEYMELSYFSKTESILIQLIQHFCN